MNYRHAYHAGNIPDVFKHISLLMLLQTLHKKEKAFCYLETHAGAAYYDLCAEVAQKTGEFRDGILRLWEQPNLAPLLHDYLAIIKKINLQLAGHDKELRFYPGSPTFAYHFLRPQDQAIYSELQPNVHQELRDYFKSSPKVHIHHRDGYESLKACLPVPERRGLVLIDPPYEQANEFDVVLNIIPIAYRRANTMTYAIWYPIKDPKLVANFHQQLAALQIPKMLIAEFCYLPTDQIQRLNGSGLVIINPPWQADEQFQKIIKLLPRYLGIDYVASNRVFQLVA